MVIIEFMYGKCYSKLQAGTEEGIITQYFRFFSRKSENKGIISQGLKGSSGRREYLIGRFRGSKEKKETNKKKGKLGNYM